VQVMACVVAAVDQYGDLMRMAVATPGNDFRLGGMEAPPAVMSTYLGDDLTAFLQAFVDDAEVGQYRAGVSLINLGLPYLPEVFVRAPAPSPRPLPSPSLPLCRSSTWACPTCRRCSCVPPRLPLVPFPHHLSPCERRRTGTR
jgi:hypothetical protein